jgi:hypothetical protein
MTDTGTKAPKGPEMHCRAASSTFPTKTFCYCVPDSSDAISASSGTWRSVS